MSDKTSRSEIEMPDLSDFYTQSRKVRREAEIARSMYFHQMVSIAVHKVAAAVRHIGDLFSFTQRMNQNARL